MRRKTVTLITAISIILCCLSSAVAVEKGTLVMSKNTDVLHITRCEALGHGLAPFDVSFEYSHGFGLTVRRLPRPGVYFQISGPPGGPLGLIALSAKANELDVLVEAYIKQELVGSVSSTLRMAATSTVCIAGMNSRAVAFSVGQGHATTHCCAVILKPKKDHEGMLLIFESPGGKAEPDCEQVLSRPEFSMIRQTFRFGPDE
jgi:hypothetical protein